MPGPHDFAVRDNIARLAPPIAHEFASPCDHLSRARRRRVHRIPRSTSVTIAIRPSDEAGWTKVAIERHRREADYFLRKDWTTQISLMRLDKSPFSRTRFFGYDGAPWRSRDPILPDGRIDQRTSWASDAMQDGGKGQDDFRLNRHHQLRHCERSEAIQGHKKDWIASSRSLSSGAHSRDPLAPRNDDEIQLNLDSSSSSVLCRARSA
jgi:hypothetical protein